MDSNVRKIQAFVAAARLGRLSAASGELGVAQSTVSRAVSGLESDWGVSLFERHGPSAMLTPDGERLLDDAEAVCDAYARLTRHVGSLHSLEDGRVGIAAPTSVVAMRLPGPLGRFVADHPKVEVNIGECTYGEAERQLRERQVELAFIPASLEGEGFVSTLFDRDEIVVVAPRGHFPHVGEGGSIAVEALLGERFIADTETAPLFQRELKNPCIHCETSDITAILAMVDAGLGISLLPSLALAKTPFDLDVLHLECPAYRTLYAVRRPDADLSLAMRAFLAYL